MSLQERFSESPIVPVVVIEDEQMAVPLADALRKAGINAMEITLRTPAGIGAIGLVKDRYPDMFVGAGSIRRAEQIDEVVAAGAEFCISPGFASELFARSEKLDVGFVPGIATAAEALQVIERGYEFVKFFPAELNGGMKMLKALSAPIPELKFFPTGGITAELARQYLALECVTCVGGTWFVSPEKLANGDFAWVEQQARMAVAPGLTF